MICCATLLLTVKLAWSALRREPQRALAAPGHCYSMAVEPARDRILHLEIGLATLLLALLSTAILDMALGHPPGALFGNLHQIGCLALGKGPAS